jgi:ankyrin repeat protein
VENRGYSALMLAAAKDQEEIAASILLENGADVNQGVPEFTQYG